MLIVIGDPTVTSRYTPMPVLRKEEFKELMQQKYFVLLLGEAFAAKLAQEKAKKHAAGKDIWKIKAERKSVWHLRTKIWQNMWHCLHG